MTTATEPNAFASREIPLRDLVSSPLNRREILEDAADIVELGKSLAQRQEVDLIVRPHGACYEVLDGNRRLAAARLTGLPSLRCQVREGCTDTDALKIIIVTQLHRANLDPLAEAGLVRRLIDCGMTREACAAELGRPVSWVAKRAALTDLAPAWSGPKRPEWASIGYLEVIARLPLPVQAELAEEYAEAWRRPHSVSEFEEEIRERYLHQLRHAPWKLDDLAVLAKAGACTTCAKRSNCQTALFDEKPGEADRCLDAVCWSEKLDAHNAAKARALAEKHPRLLVMTGRSEQPAPRALPDNAIVIQRTHGIEDCKKSDEGAMPALDVETGKQSWVRVEQWADKKIRAQLGLDEGKAGRGQGTAKPTFTGEQRRIAKRMQWRLEAARKTCGDAAEGTAPSMGLVTALLGGLESTATSDLLTAEWWDGIERLALAKSENDLREILWTMATEKLVDLLARIRIEPDTVVDPVAVERLERLLGLDPAEQLNQAMAEIPEPKRKG
jgi:ParB/RepB/Spo0J family partition protein